MFLVNSKHFPGYCYVKGSFFYFIETLDVGEQHYELAPSVRSWERGIARIDLLIGVW